MTKVVAISLECEPDERLDVTIGQEDAEPQKFSQLDIAKVIRTHHVLVNRPYAFTLAWNQRWQTRGLGAIAQLPAKIGGRLQSTPVLVLRGLILLLGIMSLPFLYGRFMVEYPCEWRTEILSESGNSTDAVQMRADPSTCELHDFLRSPYALLLGPGCVASLLVVYLLALPVLAWRGSCNEIGRVIQTLFHCFLRPKLYKVTFTRYPVWVVVVGYVLLVLELIVVAFAQGKIGFGLVIAYAVGEVYCQVVNSVLGASGFFVAIVEAELQRMHVCDGARTMWDIFKTDIQQLVLTAEQIKAVVSLFPYDDQYGRRDITTAEGWVQTVYCLDDATGSCFVC
eukprot:TRINITY_DN10423_c0_g1_i2.p1 TRINITY_DN10423_c0_g1~~TRINITY_DN10423_c0_g1_i2.p1  ORF type:complete len:339 (-),score=30.92 TRINITY_DN10423_c0_g1_i2:420-1436(-)